MKFTMILDWLAALWDTAKELYTQLKARLNKEE